MTGKEKATAPVSSVGADGKQSLCNKSNRSIADLPQKGNLQATESCPMESEKMQNKDELQTVSMLSLIHISNLEEFAEKITGRTKAVIINTPNNPTGVVYSLSLIHIFFRTNSQRDCKGYL